MCKDKASIVKLLFYGDFVLGIEKLGESLRSISEINLSLPSQIDLINKIAKGLQDMLAVNLVHYDVKPGNIVIEDDEKLDDIFNVKLIDLGFARLINTKINSVMGTI